MLLVRYFTEKQGLQSFAPAERLSQKLEADIPCSKDYDEDRKKFKGNQTAFTIYKCSVMSFKFKSI